MNEIYGVSQTTGIAQKLLSMLVPQSGAATVLALSGDLGAGKTTLVQSLAAELGIPHVINSPTFVIAKYYDVEGKGFEQLVHIDAYRIENEDELAAIGWSDLLTKPRTLIIVEWPERIKNSLPGTVHHFHIEHNNDQRNISQQ